MTEFGGADEKISLKLLAKHCVDACVRGCKEIRAVAKRNKRVMDDDGNFAMKKEKIKHTFKDENDARSALTEADVNAQSVIIGALRKSYGERFEHRRRGRWRRERKAEGR